jgi:hypothetical protein
MVLIFASRLTGLAAGAEFGVKGESVSHKDL